MLDAINIPVEGLVLLDFYTNWCGPCKLMSPILDKLTNVQVIKIDTEKYSDLAEKYNVSSLPTLVLIRDNIELKRYVGVTSQKILQDKIDIENGR